VGVVEHAVLHAHAPVRLVAGRRDLHELGAVHLGRRVAHVDIAEHQRIGWIVDLAAGAATRAARGDGDDSGQHHDSDSILHSCPPFEIEGSIAKGARSAPWINSQGPKYQPPFTSIVAPET